MPGLKDFLKECQTVKLSSAAPIFVLGNEAADCDSIISSIVFAFWSRDNARYVPVVNNRREVVELRSEVRLALSFAGITFDDLLYFDDILPIMRIKGAPVFLVDHNEPSAKWNRLAFKYEVVGILDHHADGGLFLDCPLRIIRQNASCASLVVEYFEDCIPSDASVKKMLMTALTFDTVNWTWRVTDFDVRMAGKLLNSAMSAQQLHEECAGLLKEIEDTTVSEASTDPLLLMQKDYKMYQKGSVFYGISVLHIDLTSIPKLKEVMLETMLADGIDVHIVLSAVRPPGQYSFYQQFALCTLKHYGVIFRAVEEPLQLVCINAPPSDRTFGLYNQLNLEISRKKLQPLVHSLL